MNWLKAWSRISRVWEDITRIAKVSLFKNIHVGKATILEEMLCHELPRAAVDIALFVCLDFLDQST